MLDAPEITMPDDEQMSVLLDRYLNNPRDPGAAVEMARQPEVTARYLEGFITSGRLAGLDVRSRVHIFALIGIACRHAEQNLLEKWSKVEEDGNLKQVLYRKLRMLLGQDT